MACVNPDSTVYYSGQYWNDLAAVRDHVNRQISGTPTRTWYEHFMARTHGHFTRALILNCGNGWVERELLEAGLLDSAVGIDYSEQLLADARAAAANLPLEYHRMDVNIGVFPEGPFDLVVNFAAAHHVARLDRVFRALWRLLGDGGSMVSYDYVGPHRNQWSSEAWEAAQRLNQSLPPSLRQNLQYPHLPTMIHTDPTEAVHSELIKPIFERYFELSEYIPVGGALAYPLLTHNANLMSTSDVALRDRWVGRILDADVAFLERWPESALFAYFSGRPSGGVLEHEDLLSRWESAEEQLEQRAAQHGGEYYALTPEQAKYRADEDRRQREDGGSRVPRAGAIVKLVRRTARSRVGRWLRDRSGIRYLEIRVRGRRGGTD